MATGAAPTTGTVRTGMTGVRPPQPKQNLWTRIVQWWVALNERQRLMVIAGGIAVLLVLAIGVKIQKSTAYINLYENSLSTEDLNEVSIALSQLHVPYQKTLDNHITIPPSRKVEALAALMNQGIPRHPFYQSISASNTETHEQFTVEQKRQLEQEITMVLREFNEIADANVLLVIPPDNASFFSDDKEEAKAAVVVRLKPGYEKLPIDKAKAVVNFVASSVPKLKPQNVELTDTSGRLLSQMVRESESELASPKMLEQKKSYQALLESQIRQILDPALGVGKYAVAVNVDLDENKTSTIEQVNGTSLNPRGDYIEQMQKDTETYTKGPGNSQAGPQQLAYSTEDVSSWGSKGGNYKREHILEKHRINMKETRVDVTPGQPKRMTASVLTEERLTDENERNLRAAIRNAIGFNIERGDSVSFGILPFHTDEIAQLRNMMGGTAPFPRSETGASIVMTAMLRVAMAVLILGVAGLVLFLYKEQKARMEKTQLALAANPMTTPSEISDLLHEKTGKFTGAGSTPPSPASTQRLEQLVKEKPTKVAELLKTTWLAEK